MVVTHPHKTGSAYYPVMCPACARPHEHIERGACCECGQPLDREIHKLKTMREYWDLTLRPVSEKRLREFLVGLANIKVRHSDDVDDAARLVQRYREFFPAWYPGDSYWAQQVHRFRQGDIPADELRKWSLRPLIALRNDLRRMWEMKEGDDRKDWGVYLMRKRMWALTAHPTIKDGIFDGLLSQRPPPLDALQQACLYFQAKSYSCRTCRPACMITPYFIATKRNQRYCDEVCAKAVQAEVKQVWWRIKGPKWRKERVGKKKKGRQQHGV